MIDAGIARREHEQITLRQVDIMNMPRELLDALESLEHLPGVKVWRMAGPADYLIEIAPVVPVITEVEAIPFYQQHANDTQRDWEARVRQARSHR